MFFEGRALPKEFSRGGGYSGFGRHFGDQYQEGAAKIFDAVSPFKLLEGLFVTKPMAERAAEVALAQTQASALAYSQQSRSESFRSAVKYGAMAVGALALVLLITKQRRAVAVAGYRRRSRRSRR